MSLCSMGEGGRGEGPVGLLIVTPLIVIPDAALPSPLLWRNKGTTAQKEAAQSSDRPLIFDSDSSSVPISSLRSVKRDPR